MSQVIIAVYKILHVKGCEPVTIIFNYYKALSHPKTTAKLFVSSIS